MKNRKLFVLLIVLAILLIAGTLAYQSLSKSYVPAALPEQKDAPAEAPGEPAKAAEDLAPDFTVYDEAGSELRLSDLRGKNVVINFWATWCPPCRSELPDFDAAWAERGGEIVFLMIDLTDGAEETRETVRAFLDEMGYGFPVYYDETLEAAEAYGVSAIPATVLIDREGRIVARQLGAMSGEQLNSYLDQFD